MIRDAFRWSLFQQAFYDWRRDRAARLGAALAYYTIFSLAPLLVILVAISGIVFGQEAAQGQIVAQIQGLVGKESARVIEGMLANASNEKKAGSVATLVGVALLFVGATGVFAQLQDALDTVWDVEPPKSRGVWSLVKTRWVAFTMVLGVGFLLLVSLLVSAMIAAMGTFVSDYLPVSTLLMQLVNIVISIGVVTLLFALIFKYLPNERIHWSDVLVGAFVTAVLFTVGKFFIGFYLGNSAVSSTYGAAGSLVVILLWTYYSAQILLYGAEYTQAYARTYGSHAEKARAGA